MRIQAKWQLKNDTEHKEGLKNAKIITDNKGLSLVEVIVAIMILSLVVVPTLHSITMAMGYNQKARIRQSVTVSAESVMEVFKGYDMESLRAAFDAGAIDGINTEGGSFSYTPNPVTSESDPINFKINNMKIENGSKINLVNVEVKATPVYKKDDIMEPANSNKEYDAIFRGNKELDKYAHEKAIDDFKSRNDGEYIKKFLEELNEKDERKRTLDETDIDFSCLKLKEKQTQYTVDGNETEMHVYVSVKYIYGMKDYPYYTKKTIPEAPEVSTEVAGEEGTTETSTDEIEYEEDFLDDFELKEENKINFPDTDIELFIPVSDYITDCSLKDASTGQYEFANVKVSPDKTKVRNRLFIYYFPKYNKELEYRDANGNTVYVDNIDNGSSPEGIKDTIKIKSNMDIDCYLIKQKPYSVDMTDIELKIYEDRYSTLASVEGDGNIKLYHNLGYNLGDGSLVGVPTLSSFGANIYDFVSGEGGDAIGKKYIRKDKMLVYKLEMQLFDAKTGNLVAKLDGTMGEKNLNIE